MTRFARAKGSKSSNGRVPEKASTWSEMKQSINNKKDSVINKNKKQNINSPKFNKRNGGSACLNCESTNHSRLKFKKDSGGKFVYAKCPICNEEGHASEQCPDNPKCLYPNGGACKVCGDVTHLKKDCPKYRAKQQQNSGDATISTLDWRNPDDLGNCRKNFKIKKTVDKIIRKKVVKF